MVSNGWQGRGRRARRRWLPTLHELEPRELLSAARPLVSGSPSGLGFTPQQIAHAYGFDNILLGGVQGDGTGQTIALIDAFDNPRFLNSTDPNFTQSDLHQFDLAFGLPDPPSFTKVNQRGGTSYPNTDAGWASEIALDVEWVHALAPGANLLLVEADDDSYMNLNSAAVAFARKQAGVSVVSMSFGVSHSITDLALDPLFRTPAGHPGITFVASSGDSGVPATYPAFSPNVLAVGGTTLTLDPSGNYANESAWSGSGGGVSIYEPRPGYQLGVLPGVGGRAVPDVAFDADPNTGIPVYDSLNNGASTPWDEFAGTSFAAPAWAALIAIADQARAQAGQSSLDGRTQTLPMLYHLPATDFHDITTGPRAHRGYDLSTGRGSPIADRIVAGLIGPPAVSGLGESSAQEGSPDQTFAVSGSGFNNGSLVYLGSTPLATTLVSPTQLQVTLPAPTLSEEGTLTLRVVNPAGSGAGTSNAVTFKVTEAPLTPDPAITVTVTEGTRLTNVPLAVFTDPDPNDSPTNYTASIRWGDGTPSTAGSITALGGGRFAVSGTHAYGQDGSYTVTVTISHAKAPTVTVTDAAAVSEAALSGSALAVAAVEGQAFHGVVATFTDADPTKPATAYRALLDWGDGTAATAGTITALGNGQFRVTGSHTFSEEGTGTLTVTILHDAAAPPLALTAGVTVADAILTSTGKLLAEAVNAPFTAVVAVFTDANPRAAASGFSVTVHWNDGTPTTSATVVSNGAGGFNVVATHAYATAGMYAYRVTIQDAGGSSTLATGEIGAGVAPPARQPAFAVGADAGSLPEVKVFDQTARLLLVIPAYASTYLGGVRVASGVLNGTAVVVTAPGAGHTPVVKVFNELSGKLLASFPVFGGTFAGGLSVALGDLNGDGVPDLVVGQGPGVSPQVEVFDGTTLLTTPTLLGTPLTPFDPSFMGGVTLAVGGGELVVGAGAGGEPLVNLYTFNGTAFVSRKSFDAFASSFTGGVSVAVGDVNGDGVADLIVGAGPGGSPQVNVFDGSQLALDTTTSPGLLTSFLAYDAGYAGGVRVAAVTAPDGTVGIWTAYGRGNMNRDVRTAFFSSGTLAVFDRIALDAVFAGGAFLG